MTDNCTIIQEIIEEIIKDGNQLRLQKRQERQERQEIYDSEKIEDMSYNAVLKINIIIIIFMIIFIIVSLLPYYISYRKKIKNVKNTLDEALKPKSNNEDFQKQDNIYKGITQPYNRFHPLLDKEFRVIVKENKNIEESEKSEESEESV